MTYSEFQEKTKCDNAIMEFESEAELLASMTAEDLKDFKNDELYQLQYEMCGIVDYYLVYYNDAVHILEALENGKVANKEVAEEMYKSNKGYVDIYLKLVAFRDVLDAVIESRS